MLMLFSIALMDNSWSSGTEYAEGYAKAESK